MKKMLIALDMDGTLINGGEEFSPRTIEILRRLKEEGHIIVLASGRPLRAMIPYHEAIDGNGPLIAYNGLLIENPKNPQREISYAFDKHVIQEIYEEIKPYLLSFMAEDEKTIYASEVDMYLDTYFPYATMGLKTGDALMFERDLLTALMHHEKKYDNIIQQIVEKHEGYGYRHWTGAAYSEVYRQGFNKGSCLKLIQERLGFDKETTIAIGDSDNDYEMLCLAKYAFATKGCKSKRLAAAFPPTKGDVKEEGAVSTLEELLLY